MRITYERRQTIKEYIINCYSGGPAKIYIEELLAALELAYADEKRMATEIAQNMESIRYLRKKVAELENVRPRVMTPELRQQIARSGGVAVSQDRKHMAQIGQKGGGVISQDREHMATIGQKGGLKPKKGKK